MEPLLYLLIIGLLAAIIWLLWFRTDPPPKPMPVEQKAAQFAQPRLVADQHHGVVAGKALEEARQGAGIDVGIECRQHGVILGEIIGGLAAARGF